MIEQKEHNELADKDILKIHDMLREQLISEGRLFSERMSALALINTALFAGFFYSLDAATPLIRYFFPFFGIFISFMFLGVFWAGSDASKKLRKAMQTIEQETYFECMKVKKLRLFSDILSRRSLTVWNCGELFFSLITPLALIILWSFCIAYACK